MKSAGDALGGNAVQMYREGIRQIGNMRISDDEKADRCRVMQGFIEAAEGRSDINDVLLERARVGAKWFLVDREPLTDAPQGKGNSGWTEALTIFLQCQSRIAAARSERPRRTPEKDDVRDRMEYGWAFAAWYEPIEHYLTDCARHAQELACFGTGEDEEPISRIMDRGTRIVGALTRHQTSWLRWLPEHTQSVAPMDKDWLAHIAIRGTHETVCHWWTEMVNWDASRRRGEPVFTDETGSWWEL